MDLQQFKNHDTRNVVLFISPHMKHAVGELSKISIGHSFDTQYKTYTHRLESKGDFVTDMSWPICEAIRCYIEESIVLSHCHKRKKVKITLVFIGGFNNGSVMFNVADRLNTLFDVDDKRSMFKLVKTHPQPNLKNPITRVDFTSVYFCDTSTTQNVVDTLTDFNVRLQTAMVGSFFNTHNTDKRVSKSQHLLEPHVLPEVFNKHIKQVIHKTDSFKPDVGHVFDIVTIQGKQIDSLQTDVASLNGTIEQQGKQIEQQGKQIESLNDTVEQQGKQIESLNDTVEQQDKRIELLCSDCTSLNDVVLSLSNTIEQQDKRIEELEMRMAAMEHKQQQTDVVTEQLRIDNERIIRENKELRRALVELNRENNQLKQKLND